MNIMGCKVLSNYTRKILQHVYERIATGFGGERANGYSFHSFCIRNGEPMYLCLYMGKCATQSTLELRKERSEAPQTIKSSRNMHKIPQDIQTIQKLKSIAKATVAR
jgi:hypothetical protein